MVCSSGGKMIVNSGKWPRGVGRIPRPMEGKGSDSTFLFFEELPVPPHGAGVVGSLKCCAFLYNSGILSTMILFLTLRMPYYFYNVSFLCVCLCSFPLCLHVHFACMLCV